MPSVPMFENVNWFQFLDQVSYWATILFIVVVVLVLFGMTYYFLSFPLKATIIPMYGSGKDGIFSVGKPRGNKVKWVGHRTAWRSMFPLFNKNDREPFDSEYIYPGNRILIFELNDLWIPGRINIDKDEQTLRAEINPVPYYVRNWQSLTHKKNAVEFAKTGFWEDNKHVIITVAIVAICCAACIATIYMSYKFAGSGREDARMITQAINSITNIAGSGSVPK